MKNNAFTLIELSIALVIIGLIVGGVLVGQELIKAAELRALSGKYTEYQTAVNTFRLKYNCLPGDCNKATTFFGTTDSHGNTVNNGNGNKQITEGSGATEPPGVWQHLANAGLIAGVYTGVYGGAAATYLEPGVNFPFASQKKKAQVFGLRYISVLNGTYPSDVYANGLYVSNDSNNLWWGATACTGGGGGCLSGTDSHSIDTKLDDGMPYTGKIVLNWSHSHCETSGAYNFTQSTNFCSPLLKLD